MTMEMLVDQLVTTTVTSPGEPHRELTGRSDRKEASREDSDRKLTNQKSQLQHPIPIALAIF